MARPSKHLLAQAGTRFTPVLISKGMDIPSESRQSTASGWVIPYRNKLQISIKFSTVGVRTLPVTANLTNKYGLPDAADPSDELGALFTFAPNPNEGQSTSILARVGVSFISSAQACSNAESEIPNFDFEGTKATARAAWNDILGRVQVGTDGVEEEIIELFYSSVSSPIIYI